MEPQKVLAELLLDTSWTTAEIESVLAPILKPKYNAKVIASETLTAFPYVPSRNALIRFLEIHRTWTKGIRWERVLKYQRQRHLSPSFMRRGIDFDLASCLPSFSNVGELAEWLKQPAKLLDWLGEHRHKHYVLSTIRKRSAGVRILESPKAKLKKVQQRIAREILPLIPCHRACHGFVRGRSVRSFLDNHIGNAVVLRMDLQDFFPGINGARVFGFWRSLGYPYAVTQLLTNLCTHSNLQSEIDSLLNGTSNLFDFPLSNHEPLCRESIRKLYRSKHLPQGAPTSPAIANLIAYRLDCRLTGLAQAAEVHYTRYADDLLFSGPKLFGRNIEGFVAQVGAIVLDEGFHVQFRKTRVMRSSVRQMAAGAVINRTLNIARPDYDQLKAILFNCIRSGVASQNRDAHPDFRSHLLGRILWVGQLNPARGEKLRRMFDAIQWPTPL